MECPQAEARLAFADQESVLQTVFPVLDALFDPPAVGADPVAVPGDDRCFRSVEEKAQTPCIVDRPEGHAFGIDDDPKSFGFVDEGRIEGMEPRGNLHEIEAFVPLAEMFGYAGQLRNITSASATFTMSFDHYEPVPFEKAEEIVKERQE